MNLTEIIDSITLTKINLLRGNPTLQKEYVPFIISKCLSYHEDCVLLVNELNQLGITSALEHYEFLLYTIPKRKRYGVKWEHIGKDDDELIEFIQRLYGYSDFRAREAIRLLSEDDRQYIIKKADVRDRL